MKNKQQSKINIAEMNELLEQGHTQVELAKHFDVSEARISQVKKRDLAKYKAKTNIQTTNIQTIDVLKQLYDLNSMISIINNKLFSHIGNDVFDITDRKNLPFIDAINRTMKTNMEQLKYYSETIAQLEDIYAKDTIIEKMVYVFSELCNVYPETAEFIEGQLQNGVTNAGLDNKNTIKVQTVT